MHGKGSCTDDGKLSFMLFNILIPLMLEFYHLSPKHPIEN